MLKLKFSPLLLILIGSVFLSTGCNQMADSLPNSAAKESNKDKGSHNEQALKFKKTVKPENDGPGGGSCPVTWISDEGEPWCSIVSGSEVCCCVTAAHTITQGIEYVIYRYKYYIPSSVLTEIYFTMDWDSNSSSDKDYWSGTLDSGTTTTTDGCSGGGVADCCTLGALLYSYCPGLCNLNLYVRYKTSLNGQWCICSTKYLQFNWTGYLTCS